MAHAISNTEPHRSHTRPRPALLLAAAACTTGDDDTTDTPAPALEARARSYLLTLDDLPDGWKVEPRDSESGSESDDPEYPGDVPPECEFFIEEEGLPGTLVEVESDSFEGEVGSSVSSEAAIMKDARVAADAFYFLQRLNRDCGSTIEDVFKFYLEHRLTTEAEADRGESADDVEITVIEATYEEFSFPTYGEETIASRFALLVQFDAEILPFNVDSVAVRVGDAIASFDYNHTVTAPDAPQHEQELAALLEQKLQAPTP